MHFWIVIFVLFCETLNCSSASTDDVDYLRLKFELEEMRQSLESFKAKVGVTYIRWGRKVCGGNAELVYRGHVAGKHFQQNGGGSNLLCLNESPVWGRYKPEWTWEGNIYGVEYESNLFSTANSGGYSLANHPAACAACRVPKRSSVLMIPATTRCPAGWKKEYQGYIMAQASGYGYQTSSYMCFDEAPDVAVGGISQNQGIIYVVQIGCGSLPCSRFRHGYEVTCVVCTK